ncbi:RdRP-domain-containing protein [Trametopsis cervina]|nr:RdRP-domain-containing protein [Trametopsis cervina]
MEIFMRSIGPLVDQDGLKVELARVFHSPDYAHHVGPARQLNLEVYIFPRRTRTGRCGVFTVPTAAIGQQFLNEYGGITPQRTIVLNGRIIFTQSNKPPRNHIVEQIYRMPYVDPREIQERQKRSQEVTSRSIALQAVQFGWECRDSVYSIEWEKAYSEGCSLLFDDERREFRIEHRGPKDTNLVAIRASQVRWCSAGADGPEDTLFFNLLYPPSFEKKMGEENLMMELVQALALHTGRPSTFQEQRQRQTTFEDKNSGIFEYISLSIRLVCGQTSGLRTFRELCRHASMTALDYVCPVERRGLFSPSIREEYKRWVSGLDWTVAFQVEALTRTGVMHLKDVLSLHVEIAKIVRKQGNSFAAKFVRHFATQAKALLWYGADGQSPTESVRKLFERCRSDYQPPKHRRQDRFHDADDAFQCLHVTCTPTTFRLDGPYPERSNRIVRQYASHQDCFLRVSFVDETDLQYRFDRDVDGRSFIQRRVGGILRSGLEIAGRRFEFLAYSQSALKEHAVWFVMEFRTRDGTIVNAQSIIAGLGRFDNMPSDPHLIFCPARYGARISQAFTATDSSVTVKADEIIQIDDIKTMDGAWAFTDGIGTISPELAKEVWRALSSRRRWSHRTKTYARALQVRFMGSKGMLSVDHLLSGRAICLRPSMIKFEAPESRNIEIARAFYKPGPFYLNRPFIMILEALGVPYEVFQELQRRAVANAQTAVESLEKSARLLEGYGLGASYKLTSVMLSLHKLGVDPPSYDVFWTRMMDFSINHVLRELKHHARIPVDDAWNLVGVADIHGYLKEGEVFGCIVPTDGSGPIYLEGPTMVSRSPTIHPGDVQVAHGIGPPPPGSPFAKESLRNTLVFSIKGWRPLPSFLGGGDLDGDEYRVTMLEFLLPKRTFSPANYDPAKRKMLDRPSTMEDVADFVTEYITSDSLGIIALTWLIIADQSTEGIFDPDCMKLSALHSDAVDYPKSGQPVPLANLPRLKFKSKPDWHAPETITPDPEKYYESNRAIGLLCREIELPAVEKVKRIQRAQRRQLQQNETYSEQEVYDFFVDGELTDHAVYEATSAHVAGFIQLGRFAEELVAEMWELFENYRSQLQTICVDHTLSNARDAMLTEEEAVVGTIVAKCSQPRKRKDLMSKMREQTSTLVDDIVGAMAGEEGIMPEKVLERAWVAFRLAALEGEYETFGAQSFAWVALGEIFGAIKAIEQAEYV